MATTCYIIDDEMHAIETLKAYIEKTPGFELMGASTNPLEALALFRDSGKYADITFLDVDMPELRGTEVAVLLGNNTQVIFTTAYQDYALNGFELGVSDFLLKPFPYERFLKSLYKVQGLLKSKQLQEPSRSSALFIQTEGKGKIVKLFHHDIRYMESKKNYLSIVTEEKAYLTYLSLSEMETELPAQFFRIHKSFILNTEFITHIEGTDVFLEGIPEPLPIGASYRDTFFSFVKERLVKTKRNS